MMHVVPQMDGGWELWNGHSYKKSKLRFVLVLYARTITKGKIYVHARDGHICKVITC